MESDSAIGLGPSMSCVDRAFFTTWIWPLSTEIRSVLRSGGSAIFYEPLGTNPIINLYRRLTPSMRTPDEHPLVPADFTAMRQRFADVTIDYYSFLSLAGVLVVRVPKVGGLIVGVLQRADGAWFPRRPVHWRFAWVAVVRMRA